MAIKHQQHQTIKDRIHLTGERKTLGNHDVRKVNFNILQNMWTLCRDYVQAQYGDIGIFLRKEFITFIRFSKSFKYYCSEGSSSSNARICLFIQHTCEKCSEQRGLQIQNKMEQCKQNETIRELITWHGKQTL